MSVSSETTVRLEYFGAWLRKRRLELKQTLQQCATDGDLSKGALSMIENGLYNVFQMELRAFPKLARAYKIKPEALFRRLHIL